MIDVQDLTKEYGNVAAVSKATFRIGAGEIVGFLGPNGAGKSTTIRMLTGYLPATSGAASIDGFDVFRKGNEVRARVGYLPENVPLYSDLRVIEFLRFRAQQKLVPASERRARIDYVMSRCALTERQRSVIATLSRGFRQRVGFADALIANPKVLILDEPTSGFDPLQRREMLDLIHGLVAEGKTTILFSSHILSEVQAVSKRLLVIAKGKIVADGGSEDLIRKFGENQYHIEALAGEAPARELLESIPGIVQVAKAAEAPAPGGVRYTITAKHGDDPRDAISEAFMKRGIRVRELASDRTPLETIFARLVSGAELETAAVAATEGVAAA
ncbi:MAG: ABC transporter ATP-binding protein [Planctomycetes bacterium]|nr:ABC transporter ATP-binding protein [Planctomycetota bacterium]